MSEFLYMESPRYLSPPPDTFWRWSAGGQTAEWKDGTTIAFREELATVLRPLANDGLPPFDMVMLVLAACRDSWTRFDAEVDLLVRGVEVLYRLHEAGPLLHPILEGLNRLQRLPPVMRALPARKGELLCFVFQNYPHRMSPADSLAILQLLEGGIPEDMLGPAARSKSIKQWGLELRGLLVGLERIDGERLRIWTESGLEAPVLPAPLPDVDGSPALSGRPRDLLEELTRDPQLRGLAELARHLKAVVTLPRPMADRDELPLGGVSDITNRGPLDRLMISELAYDDETLMVRIALNEALYLRRERPPDTPPRNRCLLIDSGLRMWGVPRVYATAVALALGAHPDRRTRVLRARGSALSDVDLTTREGVIAHLAVLEPHAHPGDALVPFARSLGDEDHDVVLITGADVYEDREFRRRLDECGLERVLLAIVSRGGEFRLLERSPRGEHTLLEATLRLEQLMPPPEARVPPAKPLFDPNADRQLPAIMRLREFPFRLSHAVEDADTFCLRDQKGHPAEFISVTRDRRLMLWDREGGGGLQLSDELPAGSLVTWSPPEGSRNRTSDAPLQCVLRSSDWQRLCVLTINFKTRHVDVREIPVRRFTRDCRVWLQDAAVLVDSPRDRLVTVYDTQAGRRIGELPYPAGLTLHNERFFCIRDEWRALHWDGTALRFQTVMKVTASLPVAGMFHSSVMGGPVGVLDDGNLYLPGANQIPVQHGLTPPVRLVSASPDGRSFRLSQVARTSPANVAYDRLVSLPELNVTQVQTGVEHHGPKLASVRRQREVRHQLTAIGVHNQQLVLFAKGVPLVLRLDVARQSLQLRTDRTIRRPVTGEFPFGRPRKLAKRGYRLRQVVWPDGSTAVLDSRGLLHFKSSDRSLPEFSLVLHDEHVAGWSSDGRMWGLPFFLGDAPASPVTAILETVINPFMAHLQ